MLIAEIRKWLKMKDPIVVPDATPALMASTLSPINVKRTKVIVNRAYPPTYRVYKPDSVLDLGEAVIDAILVE